MLPKKNAKLIHNGQVVYYQKTLEQHLKAINRRYPKYFNPGDSDFKMRAEKENKTPVMVSRNLEMKFLVFRVMLEDCQIVEK